MPITVEARRVRTDQRWGAVVRAGGEKPGSARVRRSLDVDHFAYVEPAGRGAARQHRRGGLSRREERRVLAAAISTIDRPRKPGTEGFFE
jgi:hypothetical protein